MTNSTYKSTRTSESQVDRDQPTPETTTCPDCDGAITTDSGSDEHFCTECGLVVGASELDHGPEWRAYDQQERQERSRTGPTLSKLQHDDGLRTRIAAEDRDHAGNKLDRDTRRKFNRLRRWDSRSKCDSKRMRNRRYANTEIKRMGSALGIGTSIQESAAELFRQAQDGNHIRGRSIEGMATGAMVVALRIHNQPKQVSDFAPVAKVELQRIQNAVKAYDRDLSLPIPVRTPLDYLPQLVGSLPVTNRGVRKARKLLKELNDQPVLTSRNPYNVAAAALYTGGIMVGSRPSLKLIKNTCSISPPTIRTITAKILTYTEQTDLTEDDIKPMSYIDLLNHFNTDWQHISGPEHLPDE